MLTVHRTRHTNMIERFLKLSEVQAMLAVSRSTLWRWTAEHGLKVVRIGSVARIKESDLKEFLSRHETTEAHAESSQVDPTDVQDEA